MYSRVTGALAVTLAMAPLLSQVMALVASSRNALTAASRLPQLRRASAKPREPDPRGQRERRARIERNARPESIPQPPGERARDEQCETTDQIEDTERR